MNTNLHKIDNSSLNSKLSEDRIRLLANLHSKHLNHIHLKQELRSLDTQTFWKHLKIVPLLQLLHFKTSLIFGLLTEIIMDTLISQVQEQTTPGIRHLCCRTHA